MNFETFKKEFNHSQKDMWAAAEAFPWADRNCYAHWLANSYHYVNNSTRILALAAGHMPTDLTHISNRFVAHAAEEKGHEKLLLNDLRNLGMTLEDCPPCEEMKFYYRSLYYWLSPAADPVGLLGWILSLEGLAAGAGPGIYKAAVAAHKAKASSFLKVHSDADPDHLNKALEIVASLDKNRLQLVLESVYNYSIQYTKVLSVIQKGHKKPVAAA